MDRVDDEAYWDALEALLATASAEEPASAPTGSKRSPWRPDFDEAE
jgi:hypothetical protein